MPGTVGQLSSGRFFSSLTQEGHSLKLRGTGEVLSGCSNPAIRGPDFYFLRTRHLGGKRSSHFAPVMPLNCPLDLFQSEKKQQRLQFYAVVALFNSITF